MYRLCSSQPFTLSKSEPKILRKQISMHCSAYFIHKVDPKAMQEMLSWMMPEPAQLTWTSPGACHLIVSSDVADNAMAIGKTSRRACVVGAVSLPCTCAE